MKKLNIILFAGLMCASTASFATTFKCYRFEGGSPTGTWIKVEANSKSEAADKAMQEYRSMGKNVDYVECEY